MAIIEEWRVREFEKGVYILAQQRNNRLSGYASQGTQHSKMKSYDRLGSTEFVERTTRYGDTPNIDVDHTRRSIILKDFHWGKLVDDIDVLRTLNDPTNPYMQIMSFGAKRRMDRLFRDRILGTALEGEDGDTSTAFPNTQKIAAVDSGSFSNMNVETLRMIKEMFDSADFDEGEEQRYIAVTSSQIRKMLTETEITSADYNTIKALAMGKIDDFMGFKFIRSELLDLETAGDTFDQTTGEYSAGGDSAVGQRRCFAWVPSGVKFVTGKGFSASVDKRTDKSNMPQIYGWFSAGCTRLEDVKVIQVNCKE